MLSEDEQKIVWKGLLGARIRAAYFAELSVRYRVVQRRFVLGSLFLSSGAFITLVTTVVPARLAWVKPTLTLLAAILSAWSLLAKNEHNSMDSADLHFRWNMLSVDYQSLWADVYSERARPRLSEVQKQDALLSRSSTAFPFDEALMVKCQAEIVMHHCPEEGAA